MRIEYLLLENFAMVKSGMGLNKLELNFKGFKNVITLIVGNNGTGKTGGVLSNLHPYSGLGHLEARDDSDIIIKGKDGHKVIIFKSKKHKYYIEHHYKWQGEKRSRKISSYIKKDDKELNPSGSVTNFNLIIETEFQIDINFLKLMRLGPNVKNFISLGATERKSFIAKLLAEVESYIRDQKYANERSTLLSNALKIAVDKKKKLDIEDITTLHDSMEGVQKRLEYYKKEKEKEIKDFFTYKGSIKTDKFDECENELKNLEGEKEDLVDELNNLPQPKYLHIELDESVDVYKKQIKDMQNKKMNIVSNLAKHNTLIESLTESLQELDGKINTTRADMETSELTEYIADLKKKIADYEANFDVNDVPSMTKEQLNSDVDKLNMILFHLDQLMQLPYYTLEYFKKNYNHYGLDVNKMDNFAHRRMEVIMGQLHQMEKKKEIPEGILQIRYLPHACKSWKECPYYLELSNEYNKVKKDVKTLKSSLLEEQECAEGLMQIASALFSIRKILSMRDPDIREYRVSEETVVQCILSQDKSLLVDHELVQSLLEKIEYHDLYVKNKASLVDAERELELIRAKTNNVDIESLVKEQGKIFVKINNHKNMVNKLDKQLKSIEQKIYATEELLQDYAIMKEYNLKSSECNYRLRDIDTKIDSCLDVIEKRNKFKEHERVYEEKIRNLDFQIKEAEREIYNLRMKESTFNQLTAEIQHVEEYYEYAELIKEAVSSRTGIPKIHIMFYCRALKTIANKIIEEIYDGELILRDFDIDDTKFNIPYYTKGANISDIRYGSQAETSVATIAISFAILMQFMPKYNIILLDEIDGPMHETNKERLFASLEGQLKSIGCEQVFLITQSKAYNNYPVNLIITDPEYSKSVTNKQAVIFQR